MKWLILPGLLLFSLYSFNLVENRRSNDLAKERDEYKAAYKRLSLSVDGNYHLLRVGVEKYDGKAKEMLANLAIKMPEAKADIEIIKLRLSEIRNENLLSTINEATAELVEIPEAK